MQWPLETDLVIAKRGEGVVAVVWSLGCGPSPRRPVKCPESGGLRLFVPASGPNRPQGAHGT